MILFESSFTVGYNDGYGVNGTIFIMVLFRYFSILLLIYVSNNDIKYKSSIYTITK